MKLTGLIGGEGGAVREKESQFLVKNLVVWMQGAALGGVSLAHKECFRYSVFVLVETPRRQLLI